MGGEGVVQNKGIIEDVKVKANKDMRSAIQLLQFYMGAASREPQLEPKKR